jgi:solute carrier family 25 (mitochondrial folate transporter), member 32
MESKEKFSSSDIAPLVAGLVGGAVSTILLYPLDLIKVRLQVNETSGCRLSSFTVMNTILKHEGILGLYQGLSPAIVGSAVSWGGYLFFYEGIKKWYRHQKDPNNASNKVYLSATENFVSACSSGAILVGLTNPIWLIKTRMQLQLTQASIATGAKKPYISMFDAFRTIVREEGVVALYKGAIPALVLTSHGGVQFVVYEYLKNSINLSNVERDPSFSVMQRFRRSFSFLMLGATSKM